jgi:hypothetical protein
MFIAPTAAATAAAEWVIIEQTALGVRMHHRSILAPLVAALLCAACGARSNQRQARDASVLPPRPDVRAPDAASRDTAPGDADPRRDQRPAPPPVHELTFFEEQRISSTETLLRVANVRTDGSAYRIHPTLRDLKLTSLVPRRHEARLEDLRFKTPSALVRGVGLPGRGTLVRFERGPEHKREQGVAYLGFDGAAELLYRTITSCTGCPQLGEYLSVGPRGEFAALTRGHVEVVLLRTDGASFANGAMALAVDAQKPYYLFPEGHALTTEALYFVTGGQKVTDPHTLWRVPLLAPDGAPKAVALGALSGGATASWISGAEGLAAHRGSPNRDLVAFTAARPKPQDGAVKMPHEDVFVARGAVATRVSTAAAAYGPAPREFVLAPSAKRAALTRVGSGGWPEVVVLDTSGVATPPRVFGTQQIFAGPDVVLEELLFVDDERLLVLAGRPYAMKLFLLELSKARWRALSHDEQPPFGLGEYPNVTAAKLGPTGRTVAMALHDEKFRESYRWVDLDTGVVGSAAADRNNLTGWTVCGPAGDQLVLPVANPGGNQRIAVVDLSAPSTPPREVEIPNSLAQYPNQLGNLACASDGRHVAFSWLPATGPLGSTLRRLFVIALDLAASASGKPLTLRRIYHDVAQLQHLFLDSHWLVVTSRSQPLRVTALEGDGRLRELKTSVATHPSTVLGSRPTSP